MKVCAIFGMLTSAAFARILPNNTRFDDILTDAAHGVLEVKYRLHFHVLRIIFHVNPSLSAPETIHHLNELDKFLDYGRELLFLCAKLRFDFCVTDNS
jgi:hypothetical protein